MLFFNAFVFVQYLFMHCIVCACNICLSSWNAIRSWWIYTVYHHGQQRALEVAILQSNILKYCLVSLGKQQLKITLSEHNDTTKPMPQICALTIGKARMLTYASYFCCNCDCNSAAQQPDEYIRASTNKIYNIWCQCRWFKQNNNSCQQQQQQDTLS